MNSGGFSFGSSVRTTETTSSTPSFFTVTSQNKANTSDTNLDGFSFGSRVRTTETTPSTSSAGSLTAVNAVPTVSSTEKKTNAQFSSRLSAPWRTVEWTEDERTSLLERLSTYSPSCRDVPLGRVLLVGPVGSGKSSFISSVQSVLDGRVTNRAMVGLRSSSSSFTKKLQSFPLRGPDGATALALYDMMGFGVGDMSGPTLHYLLSVIKGHAPEGHKFNPVEALSSETEGYIKRPNPKDQMHCVAFVLDAFKVWSNVYPKGIGATFQQLREHITDLGVHQVVLLTHVDQICTETDKNTSEVYKSVTVRNTVYKAAELLGMSPSYVIPVRNYWCELEPELNSDVLLLKALDHILQYTELFFREQTFKAAQARGPKV